MPGEIPDVDDYDEELCLFPLVMGDDEEDDDDSDSGNSPAPGYHESPLHKTTDPGTEGDKEDEDDDHEPEMPFKPLVTLRQRRHSLLTGQGLANMNINLQAAQARAQAVAQQTFDEDEEFSPRGRRDGFDARRFWKKALKLIRKLKDPWVDYHIEQYPVEKVIRHRYNALKKKWVKDEAQIKMEPQPFNHGAMRACYRLKKLSKFTRNPDWKHSQNYVAKSYMENVDRDVYFEDVRLQMEAKLWGEEYNRHNPPKKVDIFQMYVLELIDRPGSPLYHLEHFIEGRYIKYNSNSGFVEESLRLTPQVFSHFTFERSGHQLIVVDIQGVGDLWTDPQIHTSDGLGYGDGNLGPRGMALFFHSHVCNRICKSFNLAQFDLASSEKAGHSKFMEMQKNSATVVRGTEAMCVSPAASDRADLTSFLARNRSRTISTLSELSEHDYDEEEDSGSDRSPPGRFEEPMSLDTPLSPLEIFQKKYRNRVTSESEMSDDSLPSTLTEEDNDGAGKMEEERARFQHAVRRGARSSCVAHEVNMRGLTIIQGDSVLGEVHHNLAKYHEMGRFVEGDAEIDVEAAIYHEEMAAKLGIKEALVTMAHLHLNLQRDILVDISVQQNEEGINRGVEYMLQAAELGDRGAMLYVARAYETSNGLGTDRTRSLKQAVDWYQRVVHLEQPDNSGEFDATMDMPRYQINAKIAELYLQGGDGLDKDPSYAGELYNEAAEQAMAAMKGRLANKFYALAEEAWALVEE